MERGSIKRKLEENREHIRELYESGKSCDQIATMFNCNSANIYLYLRDVIGIKMRKQPSFKEYKDKILELYNSGVKNGLEICRILSLKDTTFYRYAEKLGLDFSETSTANAELSQYYGEIIQQYNDGIGCYKLSKKYNCSESSILRIVRKSGVKIRRQGV